MEQRRDNTVVVTTDIAAVMRLGGNTAQTGVYRASTLTRIILQPVICVPIRVVLNVLVLV